MKSILNKGIHELLKLAHKPVACSEQERQKYLSRAAELSSELRQWLGSNEHEKVGLGQNCNASWYLKATGNKAASYPFDWIFTTPQIILDMLDDDFEAFLDTAQLIPHGIDAGHERYHETLFGHRNPASSLADHAFFQRCKTRWDDLMQSQKPVVFLTIVLNESDKRKRWKDGFTKQFEMPTDQQLSDFDTMIQKLISLNPNCKFLFIEQYTEQKFELTVTEKNQQTIWLKFCSIDTNSGVQYLHNVDDEVMKTILQGLKS